MVDKSIEAFLTKYLQIHKYKGFYCKYSQRMCYTNNERLAITMRSDVHTINNVKKWLTENSKTQHWLATEMGLAPSLISQLFSGDRKLQPNHIEKFSFITGLTISELASSHEQTALGPLYSLRGKISNEHGERALTQLLLDAEHFVQLLSK